MRANWKWGAGLATVLGAWVFWPRGSNASGGSCDTPAVTISLDTLRSIASLARGEANRAAQHVDPLNQAMAQHCFTREEATLFLATCAAESRFAYLQRTQPQAGEEQAGDRYEGDRDLGNTQPGDGRRYVERGLIQLTGRANYTRFSQWINDPSVLTNPDQLTGRYAAWSAVFYWTQYVTKDSKRTCRDIARDASISFDDKVRRVNSAVYTGKEHTPWSNIHRAEDRQAFARTARRALNV